MLRDNGLPRHDGQAKDQTANRRKAHGTFFCTRQKFFGYRTTEKKKKIKLLKY